MQGEIQQQAKGAVDINYSRSKYVLAIVVILAVSAVIVFQTGDIVTGQLRSAISFRQMARVNPGEPMVNKDELWAEGCDPNTQTAAATCPYKAVIDGGDILLFARASVPVLGSLNNQDRESAISNEWKKEYKSGVNWGKPYWGFGKAIDNYVKNFPSTPIGKKPVSAETRKNKYNTYGIVFYDESDRPNEGIQAVDYADNQGNFQSGKVDKFLSNRGKPQSLIYSGSAKPDSGGVWKMGMTSQNPYGFLNFIDSDTGTINFQFRSYSSKQWGNSGVQFLLGDKGNLILQAKEGEYVSDGTKRGFVFKATPNGKSQAFFSCGDFDKIRWSGV